MPGPQQRYDVHPRGYANAIDPTLAEAADRVAELAGARRGMRLLEVATGTGAIARAAAGRGASVVGIDASAGMVAVAHELAPELDLRVGDGCTLPFAHAVFDAVTCGLSLSHFTEAGQVLTEVRRVLRPAGVLVASAWGRGSSFATRPLPEILDRYTEADDGIDEETWSATEQAVGVLRSAGFTDVTATSERFDGAFVDVSEAVAWFTGWPLVAERISRLDPRRRAAFLSDARAALAAVSLSWTFAFNFYVARRPPE